MIQDQLNALEQAGFFWTHDVADAEHAYYFYIYSGDHHVFVDRNTYRYPIILVVKK